MHPNEMKNRALVAAACAEMDGFIATADALRQVASACAAEATDLAWVFRNSESEDKMEMNRPGFAGG
jgi:hypothetical protein